MVYSCAELNDKMKKYKETRESRRRECVAERAVKPHPGETVCPGQCPKGAKKSGKESRPNLMKSKTKFNNKAEVMI